MQNYLDHFDKYGHEWFRGKTGVEHEILQINYLFTGTFFGEDKL